MPIPRTRLHPVLALTALLALLAGLSPLTSRAEAASYTGITQVTSAFQRSCAVLSPGAHVSCFGAAGTFGDGSPRFASQRLQPEHPVVTASGAVLTGVRHVALSASSACALRGDGSVWCWGDGFFGTVGAGQNTGPGGGSFYPRAVRVRNIPGHPGFLANIHTIAASAHHVCAASTRTIACWGQRSAGALGDGFTSGFAFTPVRVRLSLPSSVSVRQVATSVQAGAVVLSTGRVLTWGASTTRARSGGVLPGFTATTGVTQISGSPGYFQLSRTGEHSYEYRYRFEGSFCATLSSGSARCWGSNQHGQLGDGTRTTRLYPVPPRTGGVASIHAAGRSTCAHLRDRRVVCWGRGGEGQLGSGSFRDSLAPVLLRRATGAVAYVDRVFPGMDAVFTATAGQSAGAGQNASGALGDGTTTNRALLTPAGFGTNQR